jgi:hypothetical protein
MDPVYSYFRENLGKVTKEEILEALKNALESATCWREACLFLPSSKKNTSYKLVGIEGM